MSNFAIEIFDDESPKCLFYTVKLDGENISETEKFFVKYYQNEKLKTYAEELANFLSRTIGNKRGAINDFFRDERKAHALPPYPKIEVEEISILEDFPLRLYCLRLSSSCVVLFNGSEKTSQKAQDGKTSMAFHDANLFAEKIMKALKDKEIKLCEQEREILDYYNSTPISNQLF